MIVLLKIENNDVREWMVATDLDDARRQAHAAGNLELAQMLYRMGPPTFQKMLLQTGHLMLVA